MKVAQLLDCFARGRTSLADAQRLNAEPLARQLARGQACADQPTLGEWLRVPPRQSLPPSGGWGGSSFQGVRRPAALVTHARRVAVPAAWLGGGNKGKRAGGRPPRRAARQAEALAADPRTSSVRTECGLGQGKRSVIGTRKTFGSRPRARCPRCCATANPTDPTPAGNVAPHFSKKIAAIRVHACWLRIQGRRKLVRFLLPSRRRDRMML